MRIAIDYDGTFAAQPGLFRMFERNARFKFNVEVCVVTQRCEEYEEEMREHVPDNIPIYFASGYTKWRYMEMIGKKVDVWIDDNPASIVRDKLTYKGCE